MTVAAPPRPELEDALIEEARDVQRRRRRRTGLFLLAGAAVGLGVGLGVWQGGGGPGHSGSASGPQPAGPATRAREQQQIVRAARTTFIGAAKPVGSGRGWAMNGLALYWTNNDGRSWRVVTPPGLGDVIARVTDIASIGDKSIWVSASDITGNRVVHGSDRHPEILRSSDGGRSWHAVIPPGCYGCGGAYLSFLDTRHGFALNGFPDRLYATSDGGATWHLVARTPFSGRITFVDRRNGWAVADPVRWTLKGTPVGGGGLFRTVDGGRTWQHVGLEPPRAYAHDRAIAELPRFFGSTGVVAVRYRAPAARAQHLVVYVTADGGRTWSARTAPEAADISRFQWGLSGVVPFSAADARHWILLAGSLLYVTADAGKTWTAVRPPYLPPASSVLDVTFLSPTTGWAIFAVHDGAALVRTTNGGRDWTALTPPVQPNPLPPPPVRCGATCRRVS